MSKVNKKRVCLYEVLGVPQESTDSDIKKAYRKAALRWHPDKNIDNIEEATVRFKEIQDAWEILSDPQERSWYDDHRHEILRGDDDVGVGDDDGEEKEDREIARLHVMSYFSTTCFDDYDDAPNGFFAVYEGIFRALDELEHKAQRQSNARGEGNGEEFLPSPSFGNSETPYSQVRTFYTFWKNFVSCRSFAWSDKWKLPEAPDRRIRRLMEKDNKKEQTKARKHYHGIVKGLVDFVRKRDPRVKKHEQEKKELETVKQREKKMLEQQRQAQRRLEREAHRELELERMERQKEERRNRYGDEVVDNEEKQLEEENAPRDSLHCVACNKTFKSEKQWHNHERSKKHKQQVAALLTEQNRHTSTDSDDNKNKNKNNKSNNNNNQKKKFYCETCDIQFGSKKKFKSHCKSSEHKEMVDEDNNDSNDDDGDVVAAGGVGDTSDAEIPLASDFFCVPCDMPFLSKKKYKAHCKTPQHKMVLSMQPPQPEPEPEPEPESEPVAVAEDMEKGDDNDDDVEVDVENENNNEQQGNEDDKRKSKGKRKNP